MYLSYVGWYCTGDKAYYDDNGEFFIVDRLKEVMKYRNHHVSPTEIEEVLLSHPDVVEAAVVPRSHEIDGDHATAYVKKIPGSNVIHSTTNSKIPKIQFLLNCYNYYRYR